MSFWQRFYTFWIVAGVAELLSLFFLHQMELLMVFVMGKLVGGLFWSIEQKEKQAGAYGEKKDI